MDQIQASLYYARVASALLAGLAALSMTGVALADSPPLPPGEKLLFQPGLPAGWREVAMPAGAPTPPSHITSKRFAPASPLQEGWNELMTVVIMHGQRLNPASALELERKPRSEHKAGRCQVTPQMMYSDTEAANGYPAATDVVFCPDDGNGRAYLSIGKFIAGATNYYALHRSWTFPAAAAVPVPLDEQRRWVGIMTAAVVCDGQTTTSPCTIRPGISYMAITPRPPASMPASPAVDHIMTALAQTQAGASAPQADRAAAVPQSAAVQVGSLFGVSLERASRPALRSAIQANGLKAIKLDLIDGIDSFKPGAEMTGARQLEIRYAPDGRFLQADYLFQSEVRIEGLGERLKSAFGPPAASTGDTLRWKPAATLTVELRQGPGGPVLSYRRE